MPLALKSPTETDSFRRIVRTKNLSALTTADVLVSLLKRRQLRGSRDCTEATAYLLRRVVQDSKVGDVSKLLGDVQYAGQKLRAAQPKELAIGNVIRRVLGLIRDEAEEDREGKVSGHSESAPEGRSWPIGGEATSSQFGLVSSGLHRYGPLRQDGAEIGPTMDLNGANQQSSVPTRQPSSPNAVTPPAVNSILSLLYHPVSTQTASTGTPGNPSLGGQYSPSTQALANLDTAKDLRAEVVEGIEELLDEIRQADDQIAGYALEHIHPSEIILTNSSSKTIQRFLLKAAARRKFTVIQVEAYPNNHEENYEVAIGQLRANAKPSEQFTKPLTAAGVTVILIPDSAVFALMARVNKVILDAHLVLANGSLVASSGARLIAGAARVYLTPVIVLSGVYKISPAHPFDPDALLESGGPSEIIPYEDGDFRNEIEVHNPLFDFLPADLVDLYVTNLGGYAPSSLFRVVGDHYRTEDLDLEAI